MYIYFVPTNILKIRNTSLRQNGFTNDLHKNEFCSCFMNEAQVVFSVCFLTDLHRRKSFLVQRTMLLNVTVEINRHEQCDSHDAAYISNMMFSMI